MSEKLVKEWMTPKQAALWVERSKDTIYSWIIRTRRGELDPPLEMKRVIRKKDNRPGKGWLIKSDSLIAMDAIAPRRRDVRNGLGQRGGSYDSYHRIAADRRRWVEGWVSGGKRLERVLEVFNPILHDEIRRYYQAALDKQSTDQRM